MISSSTNSAKDKQSLILAAVRMPFVGVLIALLVSGCVSTRTLPHDAMLGHWQKVKQTASGDAPDFTYSITDGGEYQIFVSRSHLKRVEPNDQTLVLEYAVLTQDATNFSLNIAAQAVDGRKMSSHISFSPDRKYMYEKTLYPAAAHMPGKTIWITVTYVRIDEQTHP